MKLVIQRVSKARVDIDGQTVGSIAYGLCALVGITNTDTHAQCEWMAEKLLALRVFADDEGKMNRSLCDTGGGILLVSQFTLYGDLSKGTRPSYIPGLRRFGAYTRCKLSATDRCCHRRLRCDDAGPPHQRRTRDDYSGEVKCHSRHAQTKNGRPCFARPPASVYLLERDLTASLYSR